MLKKIDLFFTCNNTYTAKKIIYAILGNPSVAKEHYYKYPDYNSLVNFDKAAARFSIALDNAYQQLNFSYSKYRQLNETEQVRLENSIADYLIKQYGPATVSYQYAFVFIDEDFVCSIQEPFLLYPLCWEQPNCATYTEEIAKKIAELTDAFKVAISRFLSSRQYLVVAAGYLDKYSIFSKLPSDVSTIISNNLAADTDSSAICLKK